MFWVDILRSSVLYANYFALYYMLLISFVYFVQIIFASFNMGEYINKNKHSDYERFRNSDNMIPASILVPAYNEEKTVVDNVRNLLGLDYPKFEVIVINDGSTDETLNTLIKSFDLKRTEQLFKNSLETSDVKGVYRNATIPNLIVVDKENGGKADALNVGINISAYPIYVAIDADSLLESESLLKIIMPFVEDRSVVAVGGIVRILSGCLVKDGVITKVGLPKSAIAKFQVIEYLRAFMNGRMGFDKLKMTMIISGAIGAFDKSLVIEAGGYAMNCVGEDMELVVRLHRLCREKKRDYMVKFIPDSVCWTQPPISFKDLRIQRRRWHIGMINSLMLHKKMMLNPKYGRIGMIAMPFFWLFDLFAAVVETTGVILIPTSYFLGIIDLHFAIMFFSLSILYGMVLSIGAILQEEHSMKKYQLLSQLIILSFFAFIENFGFRHLNNLYKMEGIFFYKKYQKSWGKIERRKFTYEKSDSTPKFGKVV